MAHAFHRHLGLLPLACALALAACGEEAEPAYETDVTDESGGELIVTDPDAPAVEDVTVPETEMTNVPPGEADAPPAE
jgi:hypothetical protein